MNGIQEVSGSNPLISTKENLEKWLCRAKFQGFLFALNISFKELKMHFIPFIEKLSHILNCMFQKSSMVKLCLDIFNGAQVFIRVLKKSRFLKSVYRLLIMKFSHNLDTF